MTSDRLRDCCEFSRPITGGNEKEPFQSRTGLTIKTFNLIGDHFSTFFSLDVNVWFSSDNVRRN